MPNPICIPRESIYLSLSEDLPKVELPSLDPNNEWQFNLQLGETSKVELGRIHHSGIPRFVKGGPLLYLHNNQNRSSFGVGAELNITPLNLFTNLTNESVNFDIGSIGANTLVGLNTKDGNYDLDMMWSIFIEPVKIYTKVSDESFISMGLRLSQDIDLIGGKNPKSIGIVVGYGNH
jgi:hypothetical protein